MYSLAGERSIAPFKQGKNRWSIISAISVNYYKAGHISRYQQPGGGDHMVFRVGEVLGRVTERATELAKILNAVDSANVTQNLWGERWTKLTANTITHGLRGATGLDNRSVYIERGTAHRIGIKLAAEAIAAGGCMTRRAALAVMLIVVAVSFAPAASAQSYPTKPVRIVVGFSVGGVTDIMARIVAQKLGESFAQQFVVDNRPGAGTGIASEIVAKAAPDGYTLLMMGASFAVNAGIAKKLPFDPLKDFAGVALVASSPQVLVANLALPVKSVSDLIELARAKPGQLNFASSGSGSTSHLAGELLNLMAKINLTHVPYRGGSAVMMTDVIAGRMQLLFLSLPGALPQIKAGRVRGVAVTSTKRSAAAPDVPTFAESGVAGYEAASWNGVLAPAATPKLIVGKLNGEILRALRAPDVIDALSRQGADPLGSTPVEFENYLKAEIAKWKKLISASGAQID